MSDSTKKARYTGVDLARAIAIIGMFIMHSYHHAYPDNRFLSIFNGRSSVLFAVLAGMSVIFLTKKRSTLVSIPQLMIRGVLLFALGLILSQLQVGPIVILTIYGVFYFLLAPLFFRIPLIYLIPLFALSTLITPILSHQMRMERPVVEYGAAPNLHMFENLDAFGMGMQLIFLTGLFPLLTWIPFFIAGMCAGHIIGKTNRAPALFVGTGLIMGFGGLLVSHWVVDRVTTFRQIYAPEDLGRLLDSAQGVSDLGTRWWLFVYVPHSGSIVEIISSTGFALATIGICIYICRLPDAVTTVPRALGRMPLTAYTAHIIFIGYLNAAGRDLSEPIFSHINLVVPLFFAWLWFRSFKRGPLEAFISEICTRATMPLEKASTAPNQSRQHRREEKKRIARQRRLLNRGNALSSMQEEEPEKKEPTPYPRPIKNTRTAEERLAEAKTQQLDKRMLISLADSENNSESSPELHTDSDFSLPEESDYSDFSDLDAESDFDIDLDDIDLEFDSEFSTDLDDDISADIENEHSKEERDGSSSSTRRRRGRESSGISVAEALNRAKASQKTGGTRSTKKRRSSRYR